MGGASSDRNQQELHPGKQGEQQGMLGSEWKQGWHGGAASSPVRRRQHQSSTTCPARLQSGQGVEPPPAQPLQGVPPAAGEGAPAAACCCASSAKISCFCSHPLAHRPRSFRFCMLTCAGPATRLGHSISSDGQNCWSISQQVRSNGWTRARSAAGAAQQACATALPPALPAPRLRLQLPMPAQRLLPEPSLLDS